MRFFFSQKPTSAIHIQKHTIQLHVSVHANTHITKFRTTSFIHLYTHANTRANAHFTGKATKEHVVCMRDTQT